jgi:DNA polymerase III delta subunit
MYFLYHGNDPIKVRSAAQKHAAKLAGADSYESVTDESTTEMLLRDLIGARSMFRDREVYLLDTISRNEEGFEALKRLLPELKGSSNIFIIVEEKLGVKNEKTFKEFADGVEQFSGNAKREFNIFALTDALSNRDKKSLWILLIEAWAEGKTSEEIIGTLMWQLKAIHLSHLTKSADEAGLKPFVFDKAKRALRKYSAEEIAQFTHELVLLYHHGHGGKRNIDHALEGWVLRL